jgi:hypothetical protein
MSEVPWDSLPIELRMRALGLPVSQPPEANPHFLEPRRFTPPRLTVSLLYRTQQDSLGTMTLVDQRRYRHERAKAAKAGPNEAPTEQRRYRHLRNKAAKAGLSEAPLPPSLGGRKTLNDESVLPGLKQFLRRAEREGLTRTAALHRWLTETEKGKQLHGRTTDAKIARLRRKLRKL